jgi:hypothetical protein
VSKAYLNLAKVVGTSSAGTKVTDQDPSSVTTKPSYTG